MRLGKTVGKVTWCRRTDDITFDATNIAVRTGLSCSLSRWLYIRFRHHSSIEDPKSRQLGVLHLVAFAQVGKRETLLLAERVG